MDWLVNKKTEGSKSVKNLVWRGCPIKGGNSEMRKKVVKKKKESIKAELIFKKVFLEFPKR